MKEVIAVKAKTNSPQKGRRKFGHIRERDDGRIEGQFVYKGQRLSIYGNDWNDVEAELSEIHAEILRDRFIVGSRLPLCLYLEEYIAKYAKQDLKPRTRTTYKSYVKNHFANSKLGLTPLNRLDYQSIQNFFNEKAVTGKAKENIGLSEKSLKNIKVFLSEALQYAVSRLKYINANPVTGINIPSYIPPKDVRVLDQDEQAALEKAVEDYPDPNAACVLLDLYFGGRLGEVFGLKTTDFTPNFKSFTVRRTLSRLYHEDVKPEDNYTLLVLPLTRENKKTGLYLGPPKSKKSKRTVYLPTKGIMAVQRVVRYHEVIGLEPFDHFLFVNTDGYPQDPRTWTDLFYDVVDKAGISHANFHALRHTYATRGFELNIDVNTLADNLGHAKPSTTMDMYGHSLDKQKQMAASAYDSI